MQRHAWIHHDPCGHGLQVDFMTHNMTAFSDMFIRQEFKRKGKSQDSHDKSLNHCCKLDLQTDLNGFTLL